MANSKLTPTMQRAMTQAEVSGKLYRHQGGVWNNNPNSRYPHRPGVQTPTIEALVKRGLLRYSKYQTRGQSYRFGIEAEPCRS